MKTAALVSPNGKIFRRYASIASAAMTRARLPGGKFLRVVDLQVPSKRIQALKSEADAAGDTEMAKACAKALCGRPQALATVALALLAGEG